LIETLRSAVSDFEISVDDFVNDEDQSVTPWTARFRHTAELMGIPATGKSVEISGISWMRWQGDKVSQQRECAEEMMLLTALGVLPHM
jgi:predicted ester cyclase